MPLPVDGGVVEELSISYESAFTYLDLEGNDLSKVNKEERLPQRVLAPINKGDKVGEAVYFLGEKKIGSVAIVADEAVAKAGISDCFKKVWIKWLLGKEKM